MTDETKDGLGDVYYIDRVRTFGDIYEFGMMDGRSLSIILSQFAKLNIAYRKVFGFDSFEGLPEEADGVEKHGDWAVGAFNVQSICNVTKEEAKRLILSKTNNIPTLIEGWFSDSLTKDIVQIYDMQPASYINIDSDLYISAYQALDWIFSNNLWQPGTIIRYDDWVLNSGYGEEKAHKEIMEKYNIKHTNLVHIPNVHLVEIVGHHE